MRVAFYYARYGTVWDRFVASYTWGPFSHCEIVFSDGLAFSSSPRDDGVRYKLIEDIGGDHWELFNVELDAVREGNVRRWCDGQVGKKYDWVGLVCSLLAHNDKWFCSEVDLVALRVGNLFMDVNPARSSPNSWYKKCFAGGKFRSI